MFELTVLDISKDGEKQCFPDIEMCGPPQLLSLRLIERWQQAERWSIKETFWQHLAFLLDLILGGTVSGGRGRGALLDLRRLVHFTGGMVESV